MSPKIKELVPPPYKMPEALQDRGKITREKLPLMITLFAWLCFFRAVLYFICAMIVWATPDSAVGVFLIGQIGTFLKQVPPDLVFFVSAILYGLIGWRWWSRDWRARWVAMFFAFAHVARTVIGIAADHAAGTPTPISPGAQSAILLGILFNLLICLYLAFYPGVAEAFSEVPWTR